MSELKKIYIEITNRCNLACPFCAVSSRAQSFMDAALFAEVLGRIRGATRHIALHVLGEPLLHPEFDQILTCSHTHGMRVNLTTNGTLLSRHRAILLTTPALRQISISLHGLQHLKQAAADAHLMEIINFIQEASRATGLYISLRLWNLQEHASEEDRDWNCQLLARLAEAFAVATIDADGLLAARGIALAERVFLNPESRFIWPQAFSPDLGGRGYCRGLRDHIAILVDGMVVPCCLDAEGALALGNICTEPLDEILVSPRARRMREGFGHQWLVEPLCRRCTYRRRFSTPRQG